MTDEKPRRWQQNHQYIKQSRGALVEKRLHASVTFSTQYRIIGAITHKKVQREEEREALYHSGGWGSEWEERRYLDCPTERVVSRCVLFWGGMERNIL
ncbi:hypothetical protein AVEN_158842-1 [Araneus ventricosus]|uniref:Uncharacterized protein n=1 Tax=Araneus ventricosus TaxID=182803 RepID=A0A4Y2MUE9_ARAVE|nr:hypothetical protein AVEN_158842-1 [Araneus ventricosus]